MVYQYPKPNAPMHAYLNLIQSDDPQFIARAKLVLPDGRFTDFSIDRDMAYSLVTELMYHLNKHEKDVPDAPTQIPTTDPTLHETDV